MRKPSPHVNAQGGVYGSALQAASRGGHEKVVQLLLNPGADVNAQGGTYGSALQAASSKGYEKVVQILGAHSKRNKRKEKKQERGGNIE